MGQTGRLDLPLRVRLQVSSTCIKGQRHEVLFAGSSVCRLGPDIHGHQFRAQKLVLRSEVRSVGFVHPSNLHIELTWWALNVLSPGQERRSNSFTLVGETSNLIGQCTGLWRPGARVGSHCVAPNPSVATSHLRGYIAPSENRLLHVRRRRKHAESIYAMKR